MHKRWIYTWAQAFLGCLVLAMSVAGLACSDSTVPQEGERDSEQTSAETSLSDLHHDGGTNDTLVPEGPPDPGQMAKDPFALMADQSEGLVNTSKDLMAVLEQGQLKDACEKYKAAPTNRKLMLMCGKWMYFYETFETVGVPKVLATLLLEHFPDELGPGFSKLGLVLDPTSKDKLPLGMHDSVKIGGKVETIAFTCASCHFGKLPDGRYAVGAANHDYEYGKQLLVLSASASVITGLKDQSEVPTAVQKVLEPIFARAKKHETIRAAFINGLLPLLSAPGAKAPEFSDQNQIFYASWPSGTMDFLIQPLPVDDKVHTVSKISPLWGIPKETEWKAAGMLHATLAWTGGTVSLRRFLEGFVDFGGGKPADWPWARLKPLAEYIHSLRAPQPPAPKAPKLVAQGKELFASKGCLSCHSGPRGSGVKLYTFEEVGTDPGMKKWLDPELDGTPCCDIKIKPGEPLTHKIKSPRLVGLWAMKRFLHNGALDSLESLFCLNGPRPTNSADGLGTQGHTYTCEGLSKEEKEALIAFLKSN